MFFDGDNYFGMVPEITPAKLTRKTEDYQAGGMPGSVAVDLGFDAGALDMDITLGGMDAGLLKKWGIATADGMQTRYAGSYQDDSTGEAVPVEIQTRGRFTEMDPARPKPGMILPISTP